MVNNSRKLITIVGGGNIGSAWATVFLLHGHRVSLYENDFEVHAKSKKSIKKGLNLFIGSNNLFILTCNLIVMKTSLNFTV